MAVVGRPSRVGERPPWPIDATRTRFVELHAHKKRAAISRSPFESWRPKLVPTRSHMALMFKDIPASARLIYPEIYPFA